MKSRIFESRSRPWNGCFPESFIFVHIYTAAQDGLVLWYCPGNQKSIRYIIRLDIKGFDPPLKACAYTKKGIVLLPRGIARVQFVRGLCGTHARVYLVQVSDHRGTCLEDKPTKCGLCL